MTLVKLNNRQLPKTFNNLFDEFFNEFPVLGKEANAGFPPVNIFETPSAYHLELNVPGRNKEDFSVSVENGLLTVGFEKKEESRSEDVKHIRREFSFQSFKRSFTLDDKIEAEKIQAKYENGLLKFELPKKEQAKETTRQISIQ